MEDRQNITDIYLKDIYKILKISNEINVFLKRFETKRFRDIFRHIASYILVENISVFGRIDYINIQINL